MVKKDANVKKKILVADGDEVARMLMVKVLKHGGYEVTALADGKQAIAFLKENNYDLMILDLEQLNMEWDEVVRQAIELRKKISVIILTANGTLDSAIQAIRFHISDYMLKPVVPRDILDSVRNALKDAESVEIPLIPVRKLTPASRSRKPIKVEIEDGLFYNRERRKVFNQIDSISLTNTENKIFGCLVDIPDRVISPSEILYVALGYTLRNEDAARMLRPVMCRVRKKLGQLNFPKNKIQNVRGNGYLFERRPIKP